MFDPVFKLISDTLRSNERVIFEGQYDVDGGVTFTVPFVIAQTHVHRVAIDLNVVFADFPDGFAVQRMSNIQSSVVRVPVLTALPGQQTEREEIHGTFRLTVTKANWQKGQDGVIPDSLGPKGALGEEDLSLDDIIDKYRKLPKQKQQQFVTAAKLLLKGLAL